MLFRSGVIAVVLLQLEHFFLLLFGLVLVLGLDLSLIHILEQYLDCTPGSSSIMGLANDAENKVQLLMDEDIKAGEYLGCHQMCIRDSINKEDKPTQFDAELIAPFFAMVLPVCCQEAGSRRVISAAVALSLIHI